MRSAAAAPLSNGLFFSSCFVVALPVLFGLLYFFLCDLYRILLLPTVILSIGVTGLYLRAPVSFEIRGRKLMVGLRTGSREFGDVARYYPVDKPFSYGIRLSGNGGAFGATGLFWNRKFGFYRAFITNPKNLVMVEMENKKKVVISPENSAEWKSDHDRLRDDSFASDIPIDAAFGENLQVVQRRKPWF